MSADLKKLLDSCSNTAAVIKKNMERNGEIYNDYKKRLDAHDSEIKRIQTMLDALPKKYDAGWRVDPKSNTVEWNGGVYDCSSNKYGGCCAEASGQHKKCKACGKAAKCSSGGLYCRINLGPCNNAGSLKANRFQGEWNRERDRLQGDLRNATERRKNEKAPNSSYLPIPTFQCCPSIAAIVGSTVDASHINQISKCIAEKTQEYKKAVQTEKAEELRMLREAEARRVEEEEQVARNKKLAIGVGAGVTVLAIVYIVYVIKRES